MSKKFVILSVAAILAAALLVFFFVGGFRRSPGELSVTVAWNPHSIADEMVRAVADGTDTQVSIQNIPGANGAAGMNTVYGADRDGGSVLATSLSAFVTAEAMGFGESSRYDWTAWLIAFSPAVIVVAADSPFGTIDDLTEALRRNPGGYRCANSGFGTVSFAAAELLQEKNSLEFENISHAGSSPAINALINGEADFAVLLSVEAASGLRSGQLRALDTALLNFGEYYGFFIPRDTPQDKQDGIEALLQSAAVSETFAAFAGEAGLEIISPCASQSASYADRFCSLLCQTLYNAGFLPRNPGRN